MLLGRGHKPGMVLGFGVKKSKELKKPNVEITYV